MQSGYTALISVSESGTIDIVRVLANTSGVDLNFMSPLVSVEVFIVPADDGRSPDCQNAEG